VFQTGANPWVSLFFFSSLFLSFLEGKRKMFFHYSAASSQPKEQQESPIEFIIIFSPLSNIIIAPNRFESRWNYAEYFFFFMFLFKLVVRGSAIKIDCGDVPAKKGDDDSRVIDSSLFFFPTQQLYKAKISFSPFCLSLVETQTHRERKEN
jgi:hypothetical protein